LAEKAEPRRALWKKTIAPTMTENGIKPKGQTTASLWNRSTSGLVEESAVKLNYFGVSDKVLLSAGHARARWTNHGELYEKKQLRRP
jgi:hypothetical protein